MRYILKTLYFFYMTSSIFGENIDLSLDWELNENYQLSDELEKHGGKLDMKQMMRLAGHDV